MTPPTGQLAPLDGLIEAAKLVGVQITRHDVSSKEDRIHHQLYAWVTSEDGVLYLGKSESVPRVRNEESWRVAFEPKTLDIGFAALNARHDGRAVPLDHDGLDAAVAADVAGHPEWQGIDSLREYLAGTPGWGTADVEHFLVRLAVRAGYLLGNAAGQWESGWDDPRNVLAGVAVVESDALGVSKQVRDSTREELTTDEIEEPETGSS